MLDDDDNVLAVKTGYFLAFDEERQTVSVFNRAGQDMKWHDRNRKKGFRGDVYEFMRLAQIVAECCGLGIEESNPTDHSPGYKMVVVFTPPQQVR